MRRASSPLLAHWCHPLKCAVGSQVKAVKVFIWTRRFSGGSSRWVRLRVFNRCQWKVENVHFWRKKTNAHCFQSTVLPPLRLPSAWYCQQPTTEIWWQVLVRWQKRGAMKCLKQSTPKDTTSTINAAAWCPLLLGPWPQGLSLWRFNDVTTKMKVTAHYEATGRCLLGTMGFTGSFTTEQWGKGGSSNLGWGGGAEIPWLPFCKGFHWSVGNLWLKTWQCLGHLRRQAYLGRLGTAVNGELHHQGRLGVDCQLQMYAYTYTYSTS